MFTWAEAIVYALELLSRLTVTLQTRQLLRAGEAQSIAKAFQGQSDEIHKAVAAQSAVADDLRQHPDHVLRRDDFSRD